VQQGDHRLTQRAARRVHRRRATWLGLGFGLGLGLGLGLALSGLVRGGRVTRGIDGRGCK